jgi:hypothetical protein
MYIEGEVLMEGDEKLAGRAKIIIEERQLH